ncbi:DUF3748 domain-containing protein [Chitinophaga silvatica]|uniref:DUF3748 domain-containing protein n=2 Tax=Chitinophaga silvatica TaxID=2282649 RepID=A0A3E1YEH9_9BACT|nr:DUF3748 domain-containing protein [Chitinophaga silvatica]
MPACLLWCQLLFAQFRNAVQLTFEQQGHTLNSTQCFSANDSLVVFDTRNEDTKIASTNTIGILNIYTKEIKILYTIPNNTEYGPGVGAATFSPREDRVMFIQGILNADKSNPYSITRRTGVSIALKHPDNVRFMDARNIYAPYTPGALRGGTHAHSWNYDGKWISFTYNDAVMEKLGRDRRTVGVMFPKRVRVPKDSAGENNSGEMYSVVVAKVTTSPTPGSDEIDKAFDECWIGTDGYEKENGSRQKKAIAFQGNVLDSNGVTKTEVFVVDLPEKFDLKNNKTPLEGTSQSAPRAPANVTQRRITYTERGIEGPRHWLRSTPDGRLIAFLAKDSKGVINAFGVSPNGGNVSQLTFEPSDIQGGINFNPDGNYLVYFAQNTIRVTNIITGESYRIIGNLEPYGAVSWSHNGSMLVYNQYVTGTDGKKWLQIFSYKIK